MIYLQKVFGRTWLCLVSALVLVGCDPEPDDEVQKLRQELISAREAIDSRNDYIGILVLVVLISLYFILRKKTIKVSPAHDVVGNSFIVDGRNFMHPRKVKTHATLKIVVILALELCKRKSEFRFYFDGNTRHILERGNHDSDHLRVYDELLKKYSDHFHQVPAGSPADKFILHFAHEKGFVIISNDGFGEYVAKYPWLRSDKNRRIGGSYGDNSLNIPELGIAIDNEDKDLNLLVQDLHKLMAKG